jgi:hypothetical protein
MSSYYKNTNGQIQHRSSGGKFRKSTLEDIGIYNGNKEGVIYICNVCNREFVPIVHSGVCCGVNDKRVKGFVFTDAQKELMDKIKAIKQKPFLNRFDLEEIQRFEREFSSLKTA